MKTENRINQICTMYKEVSDFIKSTYGTENFIPLHEPRFIGKEKEYLADCIDSTFVSSVGKYVDLFEEHIRNFTGAKFAIATVNGTAALHTALILAGVKEGELVITQPLCFIATSNAISYLKAIPLYLDVDKETLGLSPQKMAEFLEQHAIIKEDGFTYHKQSGKKITACVPMHTFGHPVKLDELVEICGKYNIIIIEDAAESLGSIYKERQSGRFGKIAAFSFNGNKTITSGGGGVIVTDDELIGKRAKHITTTAKVPHKWEFVHDEIGYNYRLPNINAALACAQMENLEFFITKKRELASVYKAYFEDKEIAFFSEPDNARSNYWLNSVLLKNKDERDAFLKYTNENNVMTRPVWTLMNKLSMFKDCPSGNLETAEWIEQRLVNIPSSVIL